MLVMAEPGDSGRRRAGGGAEREVHDGTTGLAGSPPGLATPPEGVIVH